MPKAIFPVACALLLTATIATAQTGPVTLLSLPVPPPDQTLHYGPDPLQFGELRLPKSKAPGKLPIVLIVHGGCWVDHLPGAPPRITTYELLKPLAAALAAQGVATWNIEYRRAGSPGGGWPTTFTDLAAATDYLRIIAPAYNLDLSRITVIGHSSGGQLALWLAARPRLPKTSEIYTKDPLAPQQVIDIDGPPDLAAAEPHETDYCPIPGIVQLLGGTAAEKPTRYHDASSTAFLPLGIPQTIVTAGLLQHVGPLVTDYKTAAETKGDSVTILPLDKSGHFDMLDPSTAPGKVLIETIITAAKRPSPSPKP